MKVILFGATGMVGQGVLRECLLAPVVTEVLAVGRAPTGESHPKLRELVRADVGDVADVEDQLTGYDACFFCLGVSSVGMKEADYRRVTFDLTLAVAGLLSRRNPQMTFIYVSGSGTDSSARGRTMWARVKGETENALLALPFKAAYMFRPGYIQPMHRIRSKTFLYRAIYAVMKPLYPLWKRVFPRFVTTSEALGQAMLAVVETGAPTKLLENRDINAVAAQRALTRT